MSNILHQVERISDPKDLPITLAAHEVVKPPKISQILEESVDDLGDPIPTPTGENQYIQGMSFTFDRDGDLTYFILENSTVDGSISPFADADDLIEQFNLEQDGVPSSLLADFTYFYGRIELTQDNSTEVDLTVLNPNLGSPGYTMFYVGQNEYGENVLNESSVKFTYFIDGVTNA